MILKKDDQALEKPLMVDIVRQRFVNYILEEKRTALTKGIIIPDDLIAEMEDFSSRNVVAEIENKNELPRPKGRGITNK